MEILKIIYGHILKIITLIFGIGNAKKFDTKFRFKKTLNLKEPQSLADKVTYLELYTSSSLIEKCTDKWEVREYIKEKGLDEILVPVVGGVWNKIQDIDFKELPNEYVLKATHGCKMNYIVKDSKNLNKTNCITEMKSWLRTIYGKYSLEPHYYKIQPRIYAEKYLKDLNGLIDYKFHCINGNPEFVLVCSERKYSKNGKTMVTLDLYDMEWKPIFEVIASGMEIPGKGRVRKPAKFEEMKEIAKKLSRDFKFVRVDLYQIEDLVMFGELTFSPACGVFPYFTDKFLLEQGKKLII